MIKTAFILLSCCALVYSAYSWLAEAERHYNAALSSDQSIREITHRFSELHSQQFDPQGKLKFNLTSPRAVFHPEIETSHLDQPNITVPENTGRQIVLSGNQGLIKHDLNQLTLNGNVVVNSNRNSKSFAELRTEQLHIDLINDIAKTDSAVTIMRGQTVMQAVGMELEFNNEEIRLLSSVRGLHDK